MANMKENEKLKNQLTKAKLELEHYRGFYAGVNTIIGLLKGDEEITAKFDNVKKDNIEYFVDKISKKGKVY